MTSRFFISVLLLFCVSGLRAEVSPKRDLEKRVDAQQQKGYGFFENKIRPILVKKCYKCHAKDSKILRGGLLLDSRANIRKGGDSGPAVVPGKPADSLLIESLNYEGSEMPPDGKLSEAIIKDFTQWVKMGAPDPRDGIATKKHSVINIEEGRKFWSFQPLQQIKLPVVKDKSWSRNGIDRLLLSKMEQQELFPSADADKRTLIRRLYFDLIGLPPTAKQIDAVLNNQNNNAIEQLIDKLLASPRFGERWGRHWLDVARFSQSTGGGRSVLYKTAWRYRNYVIDSYNKDKPFDQFIIEQIAGDLIPEKRSQKRRENLTATAFLALGPTNYEQQDKNQLQMDVIDEQIQTVGKAFLGMTLGCARCHDHKFDPIPTTDYYALAGIFKSTKTLGSLGNVASWYKQPLPLTPNEQVVAASFNSKISTLKILLHETKQKQSQLKSQLDIRVVDENKAKAIGLWTKSRTVKSYYGKEYRVCADEKCKMIYHFKNIETGTYTVQVSYTPGSNRNKSTRYVIEHRDGTTTKLVDQTKIPDIGNLFYSLGTFQLNKDKGVTVTLHGKLSDGIVIADAIRLVRVKDNYQGQLSLQQLLHQFETEQTKQVNLQIELKSLQKELAKHQPTVVAVTEQSEIGDMPRLIRGELSNVGKVVPRGFMTVAHLDALQKFDTKQSGRLELAKWIASDENPLTARVAVNRIWHHLFGKGIVRTVDNFGIRGEKPSHPELLDYLARRLIDHNWSTKKMIREIVLSRSYQLSSTSTKRQRQQDPENRLFAHQMRKRLTAEAMRDSILFHSNQLVLKEWKQTIRKGTKLGYGYKFDENSRSVYLPIFRNRLHDFLVAFDFPNPNQSTGRRNNSIITTQSLYMMNSPFILEQSEAIAKKLLKPPHPSAKRLLDKLYIDLLGRSPDRSEQEQIIASFHKLKQIETDDLKVWTAITQTILASIDFRYLY